MDDVKDLVKADLEALAAAPAEERATRAGRMLSWHQEVVGEISRLRREALDELIASGYTPKELAKMLSMTRSRVDQLLSSGPKPERALFGTAAVTVAIGGKWETRTDGTGGPNVKPSAVLSAPALAAFNLISETCADYGLKASSEIVPPPGMVRLTRSNLIVMASPRLLPLVGQVLEADENLGFGTNDKGWYLIDRATGTDYWSPADDGESADYGYVGRLPRPDGKGTFLYVAGIHAMGTLGVAHYLCEHVTDLYQQVKTKRWSALVKCTYDPGSRTIESSELVTPIYIDK
uniref:sigma-70 family RNA polymerase sigma factor n=1 Tax=Amycolatopsis sp. CA-293810 TaxID=3239926 RepID=UPI003F490724